MYDQVISQESKSRKQKAIIKTSRVIQNAFQNPLSRASSISIRYFSQEFHERSELTTSPLATRLATRSTSTPSGMMTLFSSPLSSFLASHQIVVPAAVLTFAPASHGLVPMTKCAWTNFRKFSSARSLPPDPSYACDPRAS